MKLVTKTIKVRYRMFSEGELVVTRSSRCPLGMNKVYRVTECSAPLLPFALDSIVFVDGYRCGVFSEYLAPITVEELWNELADIPLTEDERIDTPFYHFEQGTPRDDIWVWFEDVLDASVAELMGQDPGE